MLVVMLPHVFSGFPLASPCLWGKLHNLYNLFHGVKASCNVLRRGTSCHSHVSANVLKVVLCGT